MSRMPTSRSTLTVAIVGTALGALAAPRAQSPAGDAKPPAFEVASIKPNVSGAAGGGMADRLGGLFTVTNLTLRNMIGSAFRDDTPLMPFQIVGGPSWIDSSRFDIVAKAASGVSLKTATTMLRTLLEDRFALKTHAETRQLPIFTLVRAKSDGTLGPQLRRSTIDCQALAQQRRADPTTAPPRPALCGMKFDIGTFSAGSVVISNLVSVLSGAVQAIVVDHTELTGSFDIDLRWSAGLPTDVASGDAPSDAPSIFAAVQEQLGLKLNPRKGRSTSS
jgi:uncharacterized protein (TIGR03435 family)